MAIYQDTYYRQTFQFTYADTGAPVNITGWTFESMIRQRLTDVSPLVTLTTLNGGWTVVDGPNGRLQMTLTQAQTNLLPVGRIMFDVIRTDAGVPGPTYQFNASQKVKQPVTRL